MRLGTGSLGGRFREVEAQRVTPQPWRGLAQSLRLRGVLLACGGVVGVGCAKPIELKEQVSNGIHTSVTVMTVADDAAVDAGHFGAASTEGSSSSATPSESISPSGDGGLSGGANVVPPTCGNQEVEDGEACEPSLDARCDEQCRRIACGNHRIDPGEDCEPPNLVTCSSACQKIVCGDGRIDETALGRECEPAGSEGCNAYCQPIRCGDQRVDAPTEDCEPPDGLGCNASCQAIVCGDGVTEGPEACDDGNQESGDTCEADCSEPTCGNGIVDDGESCEPALEDAAAGECTPSCERPRCGDGIVSKGEACELGEPECTPGCEWNECGDGIEWGEEACDSTDRSECTADCQRVICGDGNVQGLETCDPPDEKSCDKHCRLIPCVDRGAPIDAKCTKDPRHLADYDDDGADDLLCHDYMSGFMWSQKANDGRYGLAAPNYWSFSSHWCVEESQRLFKGDFNGDHQADLLCHDLASGIVAGDLSEQNGLFGAVNAQGFRAGTNDFVSPVTFCALASSRLHVGDFNGDGVDDLLCLDADAKQTSILYSSAAAVLKGQIWSGDFAWCDGPKQQLQVGDVNGDERSDLICFEPGIGLGIRYAEAISGFSAPVDLATNWCGQAGAELLLGRFDADNNVDLLCHDVQGWTEIDFAAPDDENGVFNGPDWTAPNSWCGSVTGVLYIGDANGDGIDDLVCQRTNDGRKDLDYAEPEVLFEGTDWSTTDSFCNHEGALLY